VNNFFVTSYEKKIKFRTFGNKYQLCNELTNKLSSIILKSNSLKKNICLCGGSTPIFLYQSLFRKKISWNQVEIILTDERLVNQGHIKSNKKMLIDIFLKSQISRRPNIVLINNTGTNTKYNIIKRTPFDFTILGMGDDGHTASIFNKKLISSNYQSSEFAFICKKKSESYKRLSLSEKILKKSKRTFLLIRGYNKLKLINHALANLENSNYPINAFLKNNIEIYWCP
tara:strand:- start:88 stop:771 length:684 start_codon:yes stop_codon:yes gene_type:complete